MRKFYKRHNVVGVLLFVLFFSVFSLHVIAEEQESTGKEIKVGYVPNDQMIKVDSEGNFYGYGVVYLNELAKITGWTYKFVEVNENNRIEKLINGEIDLLCNVHGECKEKDQLLFCRETTVLEYGMLAALEDNTEIFFDDYERINGKKIGINSSSDLESALVRYARENGISYEPVYFESLESMQKALQEKSIDIMLISSLRNVDNIKYVGKTYSIPEYFAVSKNNPELMDELNKTDIELKRQRPFYVAALHEAFYGQPYETLTGITREEYEYISQGKTIKVACDASSYPVGYKDEKTGEYAGIYADALELISQQSGLKFEYIPLEDYAQAWEMVKNGEADIIGGNYANNALGEEYNLIYTESYFTMKYSTVARWDEEIPEEPVIAIPEGYVGIQGYVRENEPSWKIQLYDDAEACLKAVESSDSDLALVNSIFLQTVLNLNNYDDLRIIPNMSRNVPICIGVGINSGNAEILKSILDKAIFQVSEEEIQKCISKNTINAQYVPSVRETIVNALPYIMAVLFAVVLAAVLIISKREKHYRHLALTDSVTGLWNDVKFYQETQEILERNPDKEYLLITLDINRFKFINNDFGSHAGDKMLVVLGKRIHEIFGGVAYYARGTADVFLILIEEKNFREEMLNPLKREIYFDNGGKRQYYKVVIKAGVRKIKAGEKREDIKRYADQASMARKTIKESADESIAYYDKEMKENIAREIAIENRMEAALENGEFQVYLQPKYYLSTEEIVGAEALVRWVTPDGKIVPPDQFIPLFERNGFIVKVDFCVYEQVIKQMAEWIKEGRTPICVSVNVSRVHIRTYDFFIKLNKLIEKYQIPKKYFELELTETMIGGGQGTTRDFVRECKKEGYSVSIDDFGSGYSSLNLLKDLPVDILKIDKGFLDETAESKRSSIIVQQVVEMAKKMKIGTLCEGVETLEQAYFLKDIGCDMAQGYLFSKPMPMKEFETLI